MLKTTSLYGCLLGLFLLPAISHASINLYGCSLQNIDLDFTAGYRFDKYQFSYEAEDPPPSFLFLKEFELSNVHIPTIGARAMVQTDYCWFVKGRFEYGW